MVNWLGSQPVYIETLTAIPTAVIDFSTVPFNITGLHISFGTSWLVTLFELYRFSFIQKLKFGSSQILSKCELISFMIRTKR